MNESSIREGEAPAEPRFRNGSAGASPSQSVNPTPPYSPSGFNSALNFSRNFATFGRITNWQYGWLPCSR